MWAINQSIKCPGGVAPAAQLRNNCPNDHHRPPEKDHHHHHHHHHNQLRNNCHNHDDLHVDCGMLFHWAKSFSILIVDVFFFGIHDQYYHQHHLIINHDDHHVGRWGRGHPEDQSYLEQLSFAPIPLMLPRFIITLTITIITLTITWYWVITILLSNKCSICS